MPAFTIISGANIRKAIGQCGLGYVLRAIRNDIARTNSLRTVYVNALTVAGFGDEAQSLGV